MAAHFGQMFPPTAVRVEVQTDASAAAPARPGVWLVPVKLTFTPVEDFYDQPSEAEVLEVNRLIAERNALVTWLNAFAQSDYAKSHHPDLTMGGPPTPTFIVLKSPRGKSLPAIYGKLAAERQVDRWQFSNVDLRLEVLTNIGELRSTFAADAVILGSPAAQAFLDAERAATAQATAARTRIEAEYAAMLAAATRPGMIYKGQITHGANLFGGGHGDKDTMAAEVRFVDWPGGDAYATAFTVTVPAFPTYSYTYSATLRAKLPDQPGPAADLTAHFERGTGASEGRQAAAGQMLRGLVGNYTPRQLPISVSEKGIRGMMADYTSGDFTLTATPVGAPAGAGR